MYTGRKLVTNCDCSFQKVSSVVHVLGVNPANVSGATDAWPSVAAVAPEDVVLFGDAILLKQHLLEHCPAGFVDRVVHAVLGGKISLLRLPLGNR